MNINIRKILFHILDIIFLFASYVLCDYLARKINLTLGIIIGLITYMIITILLHKIFKIEF